MPGDPAYDWARDRQDRPERGRARVRASCSRSCRRRPGPTAVGRRAVAPLDARDFGAFCRARGDPLLGELRARRARRRPLPAVRRFTVWNEPNRGPVPAAAGSARARGAEGDGAPDARLRRSAIHAVSPDAQVALGPLASRGGQGGIAPIAFLDALPRGGRVRVPTSSRSIPTWAACCRTIAATSRRPTGRSRCAISTASRTPSRTPTATRVPDLADGVRVAHRADQPGSA